MQTAYERTLLAAKKAYDDRLTCASVAREFDITECAVQRVVRIMKADMEMFNFMMEHEIPIETGVRSLSDPGLRERIFAGKPLRRSPYARRGEFPTFHVVSERDRTMAHAQLQRLSAGLSTINGVLSGLPTIRLQMAAAIAADGEMSKWAEIAKKASNTLKNLAKKIQEQERSSIETKENNSDTTRSDSNTVAIR